MSTKKFVNVLTPKGRKHNVPVEPNTTLLTVLEAVCKKHGLDPNEYDFKHQNRAIDLSMTFRFSGLANNAQLEICEAKEKRSESNVNILLQLESGKRISGTFPPSENLWNIICKLCPDESNDCNHKIINMRQEIQGSEQLKSTTLRSIGLIKGNALLRYIHRTREQLKIQAACYNYVEQSKPKQPKLEDNWDEPENKSEETFKEEVQKSKPEYTKTTENDPQNDDHTPTKYINEEKILNLFKRTNKSYLNSSMSNSSNKSNSVEKKNNIDKDQDRLDITYLGERDALIFDQSQITAVPDEDLPEDFFELTITDAKIVYRDLQTRRKELENFPLFSEKQRQLERSKRQINQYKRTIIRIRFPDLTVLQGIFKPSETIEDVHLFVQKYLNDPEVPFYLYTTPPKDILNREKSLLELNCVPRAVIIFGLDDVDKDFIFLKTNLRDRFTTPSTATLAACRSRNNIPHDDTKPSTSKGNQGE